VGGIFEIKSDSPSQAQATAVSNFPEVWDWRNVHGENWNTSIKDQGGCGSCWAFGATAATETNINLFYNQHADFNLSEQDAVSCSKAGSCEGGSQESTLRYYFNTGIVDENCFPYQASDSACLAKCGNWTDRLTKTGGIETYWTVDNEDQLKRLLLEKGSLSISLGKWHHAMALVGYTDRSSWKYVKSCNWNEICVSGAGCVPNNCAVGDKMAICSNFSQNNPQEYFPRKYNFECKTYEYIQGGGEPTSEPPPPDWNLTGINYCNQGELCTNNQCRPAAEFNISVGSQECDYYVHSENNYTYNDRGEVWQYSPGQGEHYWIFKNSWGVNWGENGYARVHLPIHEISGFSVPIGPFTLPKNHSAWPVGFDGTIKCVDKDNDGYCNWGILGVKPATCPATCKPEKDCDDSNPNLGPFDENYHCQILNISITPTPSICPNGELGNINCDSQGLINEQDLTILLRRWLPFKRPLTPPDPGQVTADLDGDSDVDLDDILILLSNWKAR